MKNRDDFLTVEDAAELAQQLGTFGYTPNQLSEIVRGGLRRGTVSDKLIALQRQAPKAR